MKKLILALMIINLLIITGCNSTTSDNLTDLDTSQETNTLATHEFHSNTTEETNTLTTHEFDSNTTEETNALTTHEFDSNTTEETNALTTHEFDLDTKEETNTLSPLELDVYTIDKDQAGNKKYCKLRSQLSYFVIKDYLQKLKTNGWKNISGDEFNVDIEKTSKITLVKDNNLLRLIIVINSTSYGYFTNSVFIKLNKGISVSDIKNRNGALSETEALNLIKNNIRPHFRDSSHIQGIFEIFIEDAFEKMNLQAFVTFNKYCSTELFLIHNGVVLEVSVGLDKACVADINGDEIYELLAVDQDWIDGFSDYIFKLFAYNYSNPEYINSQKKELHSAYYNCLVPKKDFCELHFKKIDDNNVLLVDEYDQYGIIKTEGTSLVVDHMENFPYEQWSDFYDQSLLTDIEKEIPKSPPAIKISVDNINLDYIVETIRWDGVKYKRNDPYRKILDEDLYIPSFEIVWKRENAQIISIDFGNSIPDSIIVNDDDRINRPVKRLVAIRDSNTVEFPLTQDFFWLGSSDIPNNKDRYRLFTIICTWGDNQCEYSFMINTPVRD